ncbi:hypothetical protein BC833DRAFT_361219 [Globomyces pollinis-pini]|nr:hypothetical protein BC833DRAFT_361219 [Globomyces pollinis-pini]
MDLDSSIKPSFFLGPKNYCILMRLMSQFGRRLFLCRLGVFIVEIFLALISLYIDRNDPKLVIFIPICLFTILRIVVLVYCPLYFSISIINGTEIRHRVQIEENRKHLRLLIDFALFALFIPTCIVLALTKFTNEPLISYYALIVILSTTFITLILPILAPWMILLYVISQMAVYMIVVFAKSAIQDVESARQNSRSKYFLINFLVELIYSFPVFSFVRKDSVHSMEKENLKQRSDYPPHLSSNPSIKVLELHDEDALCAICLGDYEELENIRQLGCRHHFHAECVDSWLEKMATCPLCIRNISDMK